MNAKILLRTAAAVLPLLAVAATPPAVTPMTPDVVASYDQVKPWADFVRREVMIPMRDGTKLYTVIVMKKGTRGGPILLTRSPYDAHGDAFRTNSQRADDILPAMYKEFVDDGYIIAIQDIRGLHRSEGTFILTRPIVGPLNNSGIDESTDAYDTIDWLVKNTPESNGRVGTIGSSYLGFTTLMSEINPHPALKAAVPESPMVDTWKGDDDFHNGAFRVPSYDYFLVMSTGKADAGAAIARGQGDDYSAYLESGSAGDVSRKWGIENVPFVRKVEDNPAYTDFWSLQAVDKWFAARPLTVPTMLEVGQWDQEDSYGAPAVYRALKAKYEGTDLLHLVIGPWRHSGANHYGYELGDLTFTGDTAREWRTRYMKPFLDHYLKGTPDPHTPSVLTYATGIDRWEASPRWPMGTPTPLYLTPGQGTSFTRPASAGSAGYISDPANPVPFLPRPVNMGDENQWHVWLVHDQRFVDGRPDVLSFTGAPLTAPVHIMGQPEVDLFASTSGTDSDWVVKLIDVYPNDAPEDPVQGAKPSTAGYELPIGIDIFRGRYVHDLARPAALRPGKVEEYRFTTPNVDHVFLPGHRIMVQVQSSLFPLYDRNPQTFVPNIFFAKPGDYRVAQQRIYTGGATPSAVFLPVVPLVGPAPAYCSGGVCC
ncbi:CocE/NonD family hydrolase [Sphingomonas sp.]|uniref:CocE/NonD family hydrolase n=1 Tax=Sphingomonas sp. TaxID=28214 RepID=UPI0025DB0528|nr:CocE/NonD family hydrolase [Sphingomonas sp.]MBV9528181.1 CocE/NonD family hydrolase [Sphingomonas sp.]